MSFLTSTRLSLVAIALSSLLTACGGGDSPTPSPEAPDTSVSTPDNSTPSGETPAQKFWVEGYAVKGAIDGGLISVWYHEPGAMDRDWVQIGETVRTNQNGGFRIAVPEDYSAHSLKVILQSDTQTLMHCDAQPACKTPSQGSVGFGEWFWPGNNLVLKSLVDTSDARRTVALTPLATLAVEEFLKSPDGDFSRFMELLESQEERFGLDAGALSRRPVDLAAPDLSGVQTSDLKTALLNIAFLSLVDGERWRTLGDVLKAAQANSGPNGDLPRSAGDDLDLSVELLTLAGMLQAEYLQEFLKDADVQDDILADAITGLEETLSSVGHSTSPEPAPLPQPEPTPEPEPAPVPKPEPQPEPAPAPEPEPEPHPEPAPVPEPQPEPEPAPAPKPEPQPEPTPEPVTGSAKMSWNAPSTRVNGESLAMGEIEKYIVRYGTEQSIEERSYEEVVEDGQAMTYEVAGLAEDTWYFAIKTIDTNGLESDWSVSVSKTISR